MEAAVVERRLEVDEREARHHARFGGAANAGLDRGDVLLRHVAAGHRALEDEARAPPARLEQDLHAANWPEPPVCLRWM